jgi:hypothetical protein
MFEDRDVKAHMEAVCISVLDYFEQYFRIPAEPRVACIFAKDDCIKSQLGRDVAERGGFMPTNGMVLGHFPQYVRDIIAPINKQTRKCADPYAGMVILHGSTCGSDIGLTLTFAHELQHFLQCTNAKPLWALNRLLIGLRNEEFKVWWDFPIEVEARITAKKVAESLFGTEPVKRHIQERIKAHITDNDVEDWNFVQGIDSSIPCSLAGGTKQLVQRHRGQLEEYLLRCKEEAMALGRSGLRFDELAEIDFNTLT